MKQKILDANNVTDAEGRLYHIFLKPGDLAERIILVGDTERAEKAAEMLDSIELRCANRGYLTITGQYKNERVSIMAIGMGQGSAEIALVEILQITQNPVLIRVGSCAALNPDSKLGELIISTAAIRMGNLESHYVHPGYPSFANHEVISQLVESCSTEQLDYQLGLTASAPGFYSPQGRSVPGLPCRNDNIIAELKTMNAINLEMESSVVFTLASLRHCKAGCICFVVAQRDSNEFITPQLAQTKETQALQVGLNTLLNVSATPT